jgi:hypothetical protein
MRLQTRSSQFFLAKVTHQHGFPNRGELSKRSVCDREFPLTSWINRSITSRLHFLPPGLCHGGTLRGRGEDDRLTIGSLMFLVDWRRSSIRKLKLDISQTKRGCTVLATSNWVHRLMTLWIESGEWKLDWGLSERTSNYPAELVRGWYKIRCGPQPAVKCSYRTNQ